MKNKKSMTIIEAIQSVLKGNKNGLTSKEIYSLIIEKNLYNFKAQKPDSIVNGTIRRHCYGLDFPSSSRSKYFIMVKKERGSSKYINYYPEKNGELVDTFLSSSKNELLPEENLEKYYNEHIKELKTMLMEKIMNSSAQFFEFLVVDLLLKMGYGYDSNSGSVTNYTHDHGIDGIIEEDNLGLDKIYIQAKRYSSDHKVVTSEVDQFATAMGKQGVKKGVFITTSDFVNRARDEYSKCIDNKTIRLINGEELMEYLVKFEVGLESVKSYKTYQIKESYFN